MVALRRLHVREDVSGRLQENNTMRDQWRSAQDTPIALALLIEITALRNHSYLNTMMMNGYIASKGSRTRQLENLFITLASTYLLCRQQVEASVINILANCRVRDPLGLNRI